MLRYFPFIVAVLLFFVVVGTLLSIFAVFGQFRIFTVIISVYAGLFAVYLLSRRGFFARRVWLTPVDGSEPKLLTARRMPLPKLARDSLVRCFVDQKRAEELNYDLMPDDKVLGVESNTAVYALPLSLMGIFITTEVPSSTGDLIATWWPVSYSARVYRAKLQTGRYVVQNSAILLNPEGEEWVEFTGQSISDRAPDSRNLEPYPVVLCSWEAWQTAFPYTHILFSSGRKPDLFEGYYSNNRAGLYPERQEDTRLSPKEPVVGLNIDDRLSVWSIRALEKESVLNLGKRKDRRLLLYEEASGAVCAYNPRVQGQTLTFHVKDKRGTQNEDEGYQPMLLEDKETSSVWQPISGKCLEGALKGENLDRVSISNGFWFVWERFHPSAVLFESS